MKAGSHTVMMEHEAQQQHDGNVYALPRPARQPWNWKQIGVISLIIAGSVFAGKFHERYWAGNGFTRLENMIRYDKRNPNANRDANKFHEWTEVCPDRDFKHFSCPAMFNGFFYQSLPQGETQR